MVRSVIHNTFLVYGRKVLASSQYWPTTVTSDEIDEFITTRADLLSEHGGSVDLPLIIGDKKFLARSVDIDMLLIFVTDKGEDEHVVAERLETAAKQLAKQVKDSGLRGVVKRYAALIEPAITTRLKIALVGEGGVGKTTTLQLLLGNSPPLSYVPTIALNLETVENIRFGSYSLVLWDFAGQERFRTLWKFYFHGADVIFLVCDSTLRNVIVSKDILKLIRRDATRVPVFALANKQDKPNAMKPEVILLDRSCSGLDPVSTAKVEESLRDLVKTFTIIIAPHNVQQAGRIADRVAFLLTGRIVEQGLTARVFTNPTDKRTSDYIEGRFG
jgi:small GTP-binding protein